MARSSIKARRRKVLLALLRQVRLDAGLRQTDVAVKLGKPQSFVSNYESGERRLDLLELQALCEVLGIGLRDFVSRFQAGTEADRPSK
jgi:transcriptional regulator with XRE-family HTH domain